MTEEYKRHSPVVQDLEIRTEQAVYHTLGQRGGALAINIINVADLVLAGRGHFEGRLARRIRLVAHFFQFS